MGRRNTLALRLGKYRAKCPKGDSQRNMLMPDPAAHAPTPNPAFALAVLVLVSVVFSIPCRYALDLAVEETPARCMDTGDFRDAAFQCASVPDGQK